MTPTKHPVSAGHLAKCFTCVTSWAASSPSTNRAAAPASVMAGETEAPGRDATCLERDSSYLLEKNPSVHLHTVV